MSLGGLHLFFRLFSFFLSFFPSFSFFPFLFDFFARGLRARVCFSVCFFLFGPFLFLLFSLSFFRSSHFFWKFRVFFLSSASLVCFPRLFDFTLFYGVFFYRLFLCNSADDFTGRTRTRPCFTGLFYRVFFCRRYGASSRGDSTSEKQL